MYHTMRQALQKARVQPVAFIISRATVCQRPLDTTLRSMMSDTVLYA